MKIRCVTLYDITQTGVGRRVSHIAQVSIDIIKQRNQQINFETILQIVSMRCQPENITTPQCSTQKIRRYFGTAYPTKALCWEFTFTVDRPDVFVNGNQVLGHLYGDSDGVPMLIKLDESLELPTQINITDKYKNIYYETL